MNLQGEPLRVGHHVHAAERELRPETVAFYRETFRDEHPCYRESSPSGGPIAPPLLFHSEVYLHPERWYLKNIVGNLHTRQEWMLFRPLQTGRRIHTRSTVVERYRKRSRDCVVNEVDYTDAEGQLLVRGRTHQSFLAEEPPAEGGFVVDKAAARAKKGRPVGEGPGEEIEPVELLVDESTCWRFSGPHRSYHTDRDEARKFGFPEIVVQGMLSTCLISQTLANAFGEGWFAGGRMDVKLINVAWAGESLLARGKVREEFSEGSARRRVLEVWVEKADTERTPVTVGTASALV